MHNNRNNIDNTCGPNLLMPYCIVFALLSVSLQKLLVLGQLRVHELFTNKLTTDNTMILAFAVFCDMYIIIA